MTKLNESMPFDPGFSGLCLPFTEIINAIKFEINKVKPINQKKFKFKTYEIQIENAIKNNVSFYLACLLWGSYIKSKYRHEPKNITNNPFLNIPNEELENINIEYEINNLINYLNIFTKECKFFLNKDIILDTQYKEIAESYKKFLVENNYFNEIYTTSDIKLPAEYKFILNYNDEELDKLYLTLLNIIQTGKLETLLEQDWSKTHERCKP